MISKEFVLRGRGPNTMTIESLQELSDVLTSNPDTPLLIYGDGNAFSAGLDLDALMAGDPREVTAAIEDTAEQLFLHPAPVIAAVNGHAIAGGCLMLQACDLRICSAEPSIKIGMTGVAIGINYPPKLMSILRYRLPPHCIDNVLLGAATHSPAQSLALGLVDEVVPDALTTARDRLRKLAAYPPQAYREAKLTLRGKVLNIPEAERSRFEANFTQHWAADSLGANRRDKR